MTRTPAECTMGELPKTQNVLTWINGHFASYVQLTMGTTDQR